MLNEPPTFEVVGDGELSDCAIEALAALLLDAADRAAGRDEHPPPPASRPVEPKRRRRVARTEAQRAAK